MNSKTKNAVLLLVLTIVLIVFSTLVFTISLYNQESNLAYAEDAASEPQESSGLPAWSIAVIVIIAIVACCSICYYIIFFTINKWIIIDKKLVRALKLREDIGDVTLITYKLKKEYKPLAEVYETKEEALKAIQ